MFSRRNTSTTVSRATSYSDRSSLDIDRTTSAVQTLNLNGAGKRTMSLEEEDEDDDTNVWDKIREANGPMSAVSENKSDHCSEGPTTNEVTVLRISNLLRGCTTAQVYKAFQTTKEEMRIEVLAADQALLHFERPERAMRAYFAYLASTNSLGTVSPYEPDAESLSSSPVKGPESLLRNRRSFQGSTTMLSALSSISPWRSSDKIHSHSGMPMEKEFRLGHRSNSSRSSIASRSTERIASGGKQPVSPRLAMTQMHSDNQDVDRPLTMRTPSTNKSAATTLRSVSTPVVQTHVSEPRNLAKATSSAKRFIAASLGFKSKSSQNKEAKGKTKVEAANSKLHKKENGVSGQTLR